MSIGTVIDALKSLGCDPRQSGSGWVALCPAHDDHHPSLSVGEGDDGRVLIDCKAGCGFGSVVAAMEVGVKEFFSDNGVSNTAAPPTKKSAAWDTLDLAVSWKSTRCGRRDSPVTAVKRQGWRYNDQFWMYRFDLPDGSKEFCPFRRDVDGWRMKAPDGKRPLYRRGEIAIADEVWVFEGEKCADIGRSFGLVATTPPNGAKSPRKADWVALAGKTVIAVLDHDKAGEEFGDIVRTELAKLSPKPTYKVVRLPVKNEGDDIEQWAEAVSPERDTALLLRELRAIADATPLADEVPSPAITSAIGDDPAQFPRTDLGNAERFAHRFGADVHFCHPWRKWLVFDGKRWLTDDTAAVQSMAKKTVRAILSEASTLVDDKAAKEHASWWRASESKSRIDAMLARATSEPGIPILPEQMDRDGWLLNVKNGTIDLRTGRLTQHDRADLITKLAPVDYAENAPCSRWLDFLGEIFAEDAGVIGFMQRLCGMCLTGDVSAQILPIFYGDGANGKSTLLSALQAILGPDYAATAPRGLLTGHGSNRHPTELAALHGKRLVIDSETTEGARFDEALVKQLTGSDRISARRMHEDFWDFDPTHKLMLVTNHKPEILGTKNAIWRRVKLVPFTVQIPPEKQDAKLPERLRLEYPGILTWLVRGCMDWQELGLDIPESVEAANREYCRESDVIGEFIAAECTVMDGLRARATPLFARYQQWAGKDAVNQRTFGKAMVERGFRRVQNNVTEYQGIGLRSQGDGSG